MKRIPFKDIVEAVRGAVRFEVTDGYLSFHRYTEEEYREYTPHDREALALKMPATSCVHIVFSTDSDTLSLRVRFRQASGRLFGDAIDILVDGKLYSSLGNQGKAQSELSQRVELPKGEKRIHLVLPGLYSASLGELSLADGATFTAVKAKKRMLIYGDSITQGYDAEHPSKSYANQLALALDADAVCKAIGGEVFYPPLAKMDSGVADPALITVAYGVNDWHFGAHSEQELFGNAKSFFDGLSEKYPSARIFALSPIWTLDWEKENYIPFREIPALLSRAAGKGVTVIDCFPFVPHDPALFRDGCLHPNDEGYAHYANALIAALGI